MYFDSLISQLSTTLTNNADSSDVSVIAPNNNSSNPKEKPWADKDFILDGINSNNYKAKLKMLSKFHHLCSDKLIDLGLEELQCSISQNHVNISAYRRNSHFDFNCSGQPQSYFCTGETFRENLALCVQAIGYISISNVQYDLEKYYTENLFENISLTLTNSSRVDFNESMIRGTVEKDNIRFKIKLRFNPDLLINSFDSSKSKPDTIIDIDNMEGHEFEFFCADLFRRNNYEGVEVTQGSRDQGIDIIAYRDGIKYGIQCKCYSSPIGNSAVQEVFAGKTFYQCHVGVVLTNNYFTPAAIELAQHNGIVLWNRDYLLRLIENANR